MACVLALALTAPRAAATEPAVATLPELTMEEMGQRNAEYRLTRGYREYVRGTVRAERNSVNRGTWLLGFAALADVYTTQRVIDAGGREANPLFAWAGDDAAVALGAFSLGQIALNRWADRRQAAARASARWNGYELPNRGRSQLTATAAHAVAAFWNHSQLRRAD